MAITLELSNSRAILVLHALLAANLKTQGLLDLLDGEDAKIDLERNLDERRAIIDQIDALLQRRRAAA